MLKGNTRWTAVDIQDAIRKLAFRNSTYVKKHHRALYEASVRHYITWKAAVECAGFNYENEKRRYRLKNKEI